MILCLVSRPAYIAYILTMACRSLYNVFNWFLFSFIFKLDKKREKTRKKHIKTNINFNSFYFLIYLLFGVREKEKEEGRA